MNVIDHRILIPAAPEIIWKYLSDVKNNARWQVNCKEITLLTSPNAAPAPGMRWRATTPKGRQYVAEVTAWYDRLGYEYVFVDGTSYRTNKGQIRLQEIAEGTVVQWTFQYELGGMLGGLWNAISVRRSVENEMIDSLRALYKLVGKISERDAENYEARSLMRDAPDVSARSQYKPRHPSVFDQEKAEKAETSAEDAFKPKPVNAVNTPTPTPESASVVSEFSWLDEPTIKDDDTRPRPAETITEPPAETVSVPVEEAIFAPPAPMTPPPTAVEIPTTSTPAEEPETVAEADVPASVQDQHATQEHPVTEVEAPVEPITRIVEPDISADDTHKSIFEIFGVPKPSETQEVASVSVSSAPPPLSPVPSAVKPGDAPVYTMRIGLRAKLRRKLGGVRRNT